METEACWLVHSWLAHVCGLLALGENVSPLGEVCASYKDLSSAGVAERRDEFDIVNRATLGLRFPRGMAKGWRTRWYQAGALSDVRSTCRAVGDQAVSGAWAPRHNPRFDYFVMGPALHAPCRFPNLGLNGKQQ